MSFSKKDYEKFDQAAKDRPVSLFKNNPNMSAYQLVEPTNPHTVDFYMMKDGVHVANVEVEVKAVWQGHDFPYSDIQLLPRKKKFWTEDAHHQGKPTFFVMFNRDQSRHFLVRSKIMKKIFESTNTRTYNSERSRGDAFHVLDMSNAEFDFFDYVR